MNTTERKFINADQEVVPYDGSPLHWRVSAYAFIVKENQLLIAQSAKEKLSDIIGGGIEMGESIEEALLRESMEEAGAKIKLGEFLELKQDWFYHNKGAFYQTLQLFYRAELIGELSTVGDPEMIRARFVPFNEVGKDYHLPPIAEKIFFEKIKNLKKLY